MGNFLRGLTFLLSLALGLSTQASDLYCQQVGQPGVSEAKISYQDGQPVEFSLRAPGETDYRPQNLILQVVTAGSGPWESFVVHPDIQPEDIDWSSQEYCFVEAGTLMYFMIGRAQNEYSVQLLPYFVKREPQCQEPHLRPQTIPLDCNEGTAL